jgi:Fe-S cluster biogenesis protein NfuA
MPDTNEIEEVLNSIRPAMQVDGGDLEVVGVAGGVVSVRLQGTCIHCPSASLTLKTGIEQALRARLPWVREVVRIP